jgi:imidazole glycerol-phosphate synthase
VTISRVYGHQAVVVSVDPRRVLVDPETYDGPHASELVYGERAMSLLSESDRSRAWWCQCTVSGGRGSCPLYIKELVQGVKTLGAVWVRGGYC